MRFKYLFLSFMLLILACSITAIAAEDDYGSLGDYTFDIPDGYEVVDQNDEMFTMQADDNHSVVVYKLESASDFEDLKVLVEEFGAKIGEEKSFQSGNFNVTQCDFTFQDIQGLAYVCDDGSGSMLVAYGLPGSEDAPDVNDNPARQVVDSLE